jgi:hypothetical protein
VGLRRERRVGHQRHEHCKHTHKRHELGDDGTRDSKIAGVGRVIDLWLIVECREKKNLTYRERQSRGRETCRSSSCPDSEREAWGDH